MKLLSFVHRTITHAQYWVLLMLLRVLQWLVPPTPGIILEARHVALRKMSSDAAYIFVYHMESRVALVRSYFENIVAPHISFIMKQDLGIGQFMFVSERQCLPKWIECKLPDSIAPDTVIARAVHVDDITHVLQHMMREYALVVSPQKTQRLVEYYKKHPHCNFILFGFWDGYGIVAMVNYAKMPELGVYVTL